MAGYSGAAEGPMPLRRRRRSLTERGPDLAGRNRRVIAERTGWPAGALEACEQLAAEFPGRAVDWFPEWRIATPGFDRDEGFYAWWRGDDPGYWLPGSGPGRGVYVRRPEVYGADAEALRRALTTRPE